MGRKLCELAPSVGLEVVSKVDVAEGYARECPPHSPCLIP